MKKRILVVGVLQFFLVLNSCSSDSGDNSTTTPETPVVVIKTAKVTSYSKNSGETGETISIYGENFSDKVSDIKITFDGVVATIVSSTATEIVFKLPSTVNLLPKLLLTIENRTINNEVKNDYNGNIGILPIPSSSGWFSIDNGLKKNVDIKRIQILNEKIVYYSMDDGGGGVYRTLDGGITWNEWAGNAFGSGAFFVTKNHTGWCYTLNNAGNGVYKLPEGGDFNKGTLIWKEINSDFPGIFAAYVEDDLKKGTLVSQRGDVYTTINGADFTQVYDAHLNDNGYGYGFANKSIEFDNDHIWIGGQKTVSGIKYPFILFKNNETDGWKEHYLVNEPNSYVNEVSFADVANGFLLLRGASNTIFYKTINGGDTWSKVYTGEKFTKFTFKDANTGWAVLDNKIYKTINGGSVWTLDYTHDQSIRTIAYKNNVVWAISTDKIIKRYL
jgi:photosystem II stability/assembly factor-like uncharacterized protein